MSKEPENSRTDRIMIITDVRWGVEVVKVLALVAVGFLVWLNVTYLNHDAWISALVTLVGFMIFASSTFGPKRFVGTRREVMRQLLTYGRPPTEVALRRALTEGITVSNALNIITAAHAHFSAHNPQYANDELRSVVLKLVEIYDPEKQTTKTK